MLSKLLKYGQFGRSYVGIEHTAINGDESIHALVLRLKKGELIKEKDFVVEEVNDLKAQLIKDQHLFLIVNNDQVLTKQIDKDVDEAHILSQAFPNLDMQYFYMEILRSEHSVFVSICRKDYVNELIKEYAEQQLQIIGFSLGNLAISQLTRFDLPTKFSTSNAELVLQNNEIATIAKKLDTKESVYQINGLSLSNNYLTCLAGIIRYFLNAEFNTDNMTATYQDLMSEYTQRRIFKLGFQGALTVLFLSLLISFLFFTNYTQQKNTLSEELSLNKSARNTLVLLKSEVDQKEKLIEDYSLSSSKSTFYLDELGNSVPNSILLNKMEYQPLEKKIKADENINVVENVILVNGMLSKSKDFSVWVNNLEEITWIDKITIEDYGMDKDAKLTFKIRIQLK